MPRHHLFSDAPTPSEGCVPPASAVADRKYKKVMVEDFRVCNRVLTEEEKKLKAIEDKFIYFDDIECPAFVKDPGHKSISELGTIVDSFDAKQLCVSEYGTPPGGVPVLEFKKGDPLVDMLTKCAKLAINDYNSKTKTNYRFVDFEMAVWELVNGVFYHITFRAKNAAKDYQTFEATVFANKLMREVVETRMKGSDTWYAGTLRELID